ncbi:MAG: hypothetical protein DMD74_01885 [Gemmatimonadetes bacterium]|nr:MAG: hypothetical protein DMD74_01885 [Gemmatimonadota bacterium]
MVTASDRLGSVTTQIAGLLQTSATQLLANARAVADSPAVRAYLRAPAPRMRAAALAAMRPVGPAAQQIADVELVSTGGARLLSLTDSASHGTPAVNPEMVLAGSRSDSGVIRPFEIVRDSLRYAVTAPVKEGGRILGYLVQWRHLTSSARGRGQLNQLIGPGARLYVTNSSGDLWTDLAARVPPPSPPLDLQRAAAGVVRYERPGLGEVLATARAVRGAPWAVVVEFPRKVVLAPARLFLRSQVFRIGAVLLVGLLAAWGLSGTITPRLRRLTDAAEAVAAGDYSRQVRVERRDELGRLAGAFNVMAHNVQESQQHLEAQVRELQATRSRLEQLVNASDAMIYASRVAGEATVPVYVSENITRLTGYEVQEVLRPDWLRDIVHPEDRERIRGELGEQFATGQFTIEYRFRHKDGSYRWILDEGRVRHDATGHAVEVVGAWIDITERKRLETQLRQAQKMEAIGQLAGGVAHDFNNVLTAIAGNAELLQEGFADGDPKRETVEEIRTAASRAESLTRQLLAFSRQQIMQPKVLKLNRVVAGMEKMLRRLIGEDIDLVCVLPNDVGQVVADPSQIEQVILNLAVNARDAMPTGGKLTIETGNAEFDAIYARAHPPAVPGRFVMIAVSDSGSGMSPEVQARVFEPFFTGDEVILLVEDEAAVRRVALHALQRYGYTVLEAALPSEALTICREHTGKIDLVVTDVVMPGMSGPDLAQQLLALRPALKVLLSSGYPGEAIAHRGELFSGLAFLPKPFTPTGLARKVREVLDAPAPQAHRPPAH